MRLSGRPFRNPRRALDPEEGPPPQRYDAELSISVQARGDRVRIALAGELDLSNARQFAAALAEAEAAGTAELEIDLRGLEFIDSSGLAELFAANRRAKDAGRHISIVKDHGPIERVLNIARVEDVIDVVEQPAR